MSTPGRAYFCCNGHLLASYTHDEYGEDENHTICPECLSEDIAIQWEWGDDDYPQFVPIQPIKTPHTYFVKGLFADRDRDLPDDGNLT